MIQQAPNTMLKNAVHQHKLLSRRGLMERLFAFWFDSLVYNQIWEDPRVDMQALQLKSNSRLLTIASGGCNVLGYLVKQPEAIIAVDLNCQHIYLTRLKLAALRHLPTYNDFFEFFGCANLKSNLEVYARYLRQNLDEATRNFWEGGCWLRRKVLGARINYFAENLYNFAKLGYLLRFAHGLGKLTRRDPARLLKASSLQEQERIFKETIAPFFDAKLVKFIASHPLVLFSLGIPPSQYDRLKKEKPRDIIAVYYERVHRLTCEFPVSDNYFAWQALSRRYDLENRQAVPDYLKEDGYQIRKQAAGRVQTVATSLTAYLHQQPDQSLDRFVLLDSQDWMRPAELVELWTEIVRTGRPGTRVIFRTGASASPVETVLPKNLRQRFIYELELSQELHRLDRSAIYGGFHLYRMPD
jgi:S-adenosylmethionine-diacylglycerol 3-amino-3-carboxypropyl transferase